MKKKTYYDLNDAIPMLRKRLSDKWGVRRLFRWLHDAYPYHGDTILQNLILIESEKLGISYNDAVISYFKLYVKRYQ